MNLSRQPSLAAALCLSLALTSCKKDPAPSAVADTPGENVTTASGLSYQVLRPGTGKEAKSGDKVSVHYVGTLQTTGAKFDSSRDRNRPFEFSLGQGMVIAGWDEGVAGMKEGERRKLVIPPGLGYGGRNMGAIPPDSTLVFEVELIEVR